jgi:hypothetical protein
MHKFQNATAGHYIKPASVRVFIPFISEEILPESKYTTPFIHAQAYGPEPTENRDET